MAADAPVPQPPCHQPRSAMPALNPLLTATTPSPVMEARRWLTETPLPAGLPLVNLSQAAPVEPPPAPMRAAMAAMLEEAETHLYGPVLGLPALRVEIAAQWSAAYGGTITPEDVAVTAGCNQAFCAAITALAAAGDRVILPVPWYFNHQMWLAQMGIAIDPLRCGPDMVPDLDAARALIRPRTRAIVLVSPNNPSGAEYPPDRIAAFAALAREAGIALLLDETYRDFLGGEGRPHALFAEPDWRETLVHLYSFSKAYRLTGHRTGAVIAAPPLLAEIEKFLDTVSICAPQLGQRAALWGLRNLGAWVAGERAEILRRRDAIAQGFARLPGWRLLGCGAYFAYVEHPFDAPSDVVARRLLATRGLLVLPGTMFGPTRAQGGDGGPERQLRIAFANADVAGLGEVIDRMASLDVRALVSKAASA